MAEFVETAFSFPTAIFSVLLALVLLYWLTVILGALDLDSLDSWMGLEGAEGAAQGALEGLDGGGFGDGAELGDAAGAEGAEGASEGLMDRLGVSGVPITIILSFFALFGWIISYAGMQMLDDSGAVAGLAVSGALIGVAAMLIGLVATVIAVRPLRRLFAIAGAPSRASFVGSVCRISTGRVDEDFGQAEIDDGGAGLIVQVRCNEENQLRRGSQALIFDYDPDGEVFKVVALEDDLLRDAGSRTN
ncbi:MAG: hypothetical protein V3T83_00625 [Acidobacteriota bacterium]